MSAGASGGEKGDDVPVYLMPVAAILGMYTVLASLKALYQVYRNVTHNDATATAEQKLNAPQPLTSRSFLLLIASIVASVLAYGYVVAQVENSISSSSGVFDPYDILAVDPFHSNSTAIKQAYRTLSRMHHPDKGGDARTFHKISLAYRALTDPVAKSNYERYGHPDGPQTHTLSFALPEWLLHPRGTTAGVLVILYLGLFASLIAWVIGYTRRTTQKEHDQSQSRSVAGADVSYLAVNLQPDSTHLDVLFLIATTPENIAVAQKDLDRANELRSKKTEWKREEERKHQRLGGRIEFDLDNEGWEDDDATNSDKNNNNNDDGDGGEKDDDYGDDEIDKATRAAEEAAKRAEQEKAREAAQLAVATGKAEQAENIKLEGIDEGVLGQVWVERVLKEKAGVWPPKLGDALEGKTFVETMGGKKNKKRVVGPLEHGAIRRNLVMTMGRLNAQLLNTHEDLITAGQKGLIDPTYFKSTMEFRQRTGLLLEAALRVAVSARSYRLAKTVIETVSMFKIGAMSPDDPKTLEWFTAAMKRQYGGDEGVPRLDIQEKSIETPGEDEIATGDTCALQMQIERKHAENFTKQKVALCQKQGIPPQVALQTYREGWWILLRAKRIGGDEVTEKEEEEKEEEESANNLLSKVLEGEAKKKFESEKDENRLLTAWPFIVTNLAQKTGKVRVQFKAPGVPGRYKFYVAIKSQEFLGADQEFILETDILDQAEVERKEEEAEEEGDDKEGEEDEHKNEDEDESKKDK